MITQLLIDEAESPQLFRWSGRRSSVEVPSWVAEQGFVAPPDLIWLWTYSGGGTMFETEHLLRPLDSESKVLDLVPVSTVCHERGMPTNQLMFHEGFCVSSWDQSAEKVRTFLLDGLEPLGECASLAQWYTGFIRREFADRYGLSAHSAN